MQDILSFVQTKSSPLALSSSSMTTDANVATKSSDGTFAENFFSMILEKVTQGNSAESLNNLETLPQMTLASSHTETSLISTDEGEAKSIDEHLLEDLLSVVNALQQNSQTTSFPTLKASSSLEKILNSETARQDFANVKSVSDLLDLSKKYNLGLEKLSISQETIENLQTKFPDLTQNNFFDDLNSALNKAQNTQQSTASQSTASTQMNLMNLLNKQQPKEMPQTTTSSILSDLISQDIATQTPTPIPSSTVSTNDALTSLAQELPSVPVNEKQQTNTTTPILLTDETEAATTTVKPLETIIQKALNTASTQQETQKQTTELDVTGEESLAEVIKPVRGNEHKTESSASSSQEPLSTPVKSTKTEILDENANANDTKLTSFTNMASTKEETTTETTSKDAQNALDIKNDLTLKVTTKQDTSSNKTPSSIKESLSQFASNLKEQIEAYKPPIMKVELSLSPKSLGDVDVTLLTRGNNLHVNISSNTTTMNLFTQNQDEVKSALVNMGFTHLEMNFSDQRQQEQAQQNQTKHNDNGRYNDNFTDATEEETSLLEIVLPQYV